MGNPKHTCVGDRGRPWGDLGELVAQGVLSSVKASEMHPKLPEGPGWRLPTGTQVSNGPSLLLPPPRSAAQLPP